MREIVLGHRGVRWAGVVLTATAVLCCSCRRLASIAKKLSGVAGNRAETIAETVSVTKPATVKVVEWIYQGGRKGEWLDWGWAKHDDRPNGPARIDMSNWSGWVLARPGLGGEYGALVFRFRAPAAFGEFLDIHVEAADQKGPHVRPTVASSQLTPVADGWTEAYVPVSSLDPDGMSWDRIVFYVSKSVPSDWVEFDQIGLTQAPLPVIRSVDGALSVECAGTSKRIHPHIYGIALDLMKDSKETHQWALGATARRWGGNAMSRYNWEHGHAWNTANDWFFENVDYAPRAGYTYVDFLKDNAARGVASVLTVPTIGWVAKDTSSVGFPKSLLPEQASFDSWRPEAGNGMAKDGKTPLPSGPPSRTSIPAPPEFIGRWVQAIRAIDAMTGQRSVSQYILDNEPGIWNATHRDVHPDPVTYDELVDRTIAYGTAIRRADPQAVIAGPAEWGWPNYLYSAKDMKEGHRAKPDRRAHGDLPILAYYLKRLAEYEKQSGVRALDVLDVHFYPQASKVYSETNDRATAALRIRQTRGLWDESYQDESWIDDTIRLLPRLSEWIAQYYPGTGISIGEWSFGGATHLSGAIATAIALGRFGQHGVTSAFYWCYPPDKSPAFYAFRAFRNYDGSGAKFESLSIPTKATEGVSLFASRSEDAKRVVLVAVNEKPDVSLRARLALDGCASFTTAKVFSYTGQAEGFGPPTAVPIVQDTITADLPPYSISVLELATAP